MGVHRQETLSNSIGITISTSEGSRIFKYDEVLISALKKKKKREKKMKMFGRIEKERKKSERKIILIYLFI